MLAYKFGKKDIIRLYNLHANQPFWQMYAKCNKSWFKQTVEEGIFSYKCLSDKVIYNHRLDRVVDGVAIVRLAFVKFADVGKMIAPHIDNERKIKNATHVVNFVEEIIVLLVLWFMFNSVEQPLAANVYDGLMK